jgi:hypothetical protein
VNGQKVFDGFDLDDDPTIDDKVDSVAAVEEDSSSPGPR